MGDSYESDLLKTAVEAIGEFCIVFKDKMEFSDVKKSIEELKKKMSVNPNIFSQSEILQIKDQSIYSLGQIISFASFGQENQEEIKQWIEMWLNGMPFTTITLKMIYQAEILIQLLYKKSEIFVEDKKIFKRSLGLLGKIYKSKVWSHETLDQKILGVFDSLKKLEYLRPLLFEAMNAQEGTTKVKMMSLVN